MSSLSVFEASSEKMVVIAKLGATYGLQGDIKLYVLSESIESPFSYSQWWIKTSSAKNWSELKNEEVYRLGTKILIKLSGVDSPEMASTYVNAKIGVPRKNLPTPDEDEYYWTDLEGMSVKNKSGVCFGMVSHVMETGANDVLVIQNEAKEETLIPFIEHYILDVDNDQNKILVDWETDYL